MNPQNEKNAAYEDEISLYEFWKGIIKRKKIILEIFLICVISTAIISLTMEKVYRGEAVLRIEMKEKEKELITARELIDIIGKVDRETITAIFPEKPSTIEGVKITHLSGSTDKIRVSVDLKEAIYFQDFVMGFIKYINNIPFFKSHIEQKREKLEKRLEEIDVVIEKSQKDANSFQKMIIKEKLNPIGFNPIDFNKALSELKIEKMTLRHSLKNPTGIEIIKPPAVPNKPVKPKPLLYIIISGLTSLILGAFVAGFLNFVKSSKRKIGL